MPNPPRYYPARAFPDSRYLPGVGPHPSAGQPSEPAPESWSGDAATLRSHPDYLWGVDLYNHGYYWEAHEAWEDLWKQVERDTREGRLLQGLILCTAAALKASMGQTTASRGLVERGVAKLLSGFVPSPGHYVGVDVPAFVQGVRAFAAGVRRTPPELRLAQPETAREV